MKKASHQRRPERLANLVKEVLAEVLARGLRDPRVHDVTVTRVDVSGDLSVATVWFSMLNADDVAKDEACAGLEKASGFLRSRLAENLSTRSVPELRFKVDRNLEHAARIDELFRQIHQDEPNEE